MGRYGYRVIDADGHVFEPPSLFHDFCDKYLDPEYRPVLRRIMAEARGAPGSPSIQLYAHKSRVPIVQTDRPLGIPNPTQRMQRDGYKKGAKGAVVEHMWDPKVRLDDMDMEGIDVAVVYPSGMSSFCAWEDTALEAAMYTAYNRAVADYCAASPDRLKWVALVSMRDIEAGVMEVRRSAQDQTMVGVYVSGHMDDRLLDDPVFYPLWEEALSLDLPIVVHGGTARPPYGCGTFEMSGNWFLQHSSTNPFEQMRAMASLIGGGVLDRFPKLRFAFLEAGVGWLPYWLDRLDEHAEMMPRYVPLLKRTPRQAFLEGSRCFVSCDPDESTLEFVVPMIGEERILYASDYPHFDSRFPDTVRLIAEHPRLKDSAKRKILGENALRLYPRVASKVRV